MLKTYLQDVRSWLSERIDGRIEDHKILGELLVALNYGEPVLQVFQRDVFNLLAGDFAKLVHDVDVVDAMLAPRRDRLASLDNIPSGLNRSKLCLNF